MGTVASENPLVCATACGISTCLDCVKGKYSGDTGRTEVADCKVSVTDFDRCICFEFQHFNTNSDFLIFMSLSVKLHQPCEEGTYNLNDGAGHVSLCRECETGRYSKTEGRETPCEVCVEGKYSKHSKSTSVCKDCPAGWSQSDQIQSLCNMCLPGLAELTKGQAACSECVVGKYSPVPKSTSCTNCDQGGCLLFVVCLFFGCYFLYF